MKKFFHCIIRLLRNLSPIYCIGFVSVLGMILFLAKTLLIVRLYLTANRYLFPIIPIYYFVFFVGLYYIGKAFCFPMKHMKYIFAITIIICSLSSNIQFPPIYGYKNSIHEGKTMDALEENSTIIIATSEGWLLTTYPFRLLQVGNICAVDLTYLFDYKNELDTLPNSSANTPIYLILDTTKLIHNHEVTEEAIVANVHTFKNMHPEYTYEDYLEYFASLPYAEKCELVGRDSAYGSPLEIYQLR